MPLTRGHQKVEVSEEAEQAWIDLLLTGPGRMIGSQVRAITTTKDRSLDLPRDYPLAIRRCQRLL